MPNPYPMRRLCVAAYDITDSKRRRLVHRILRDFAVGGQKSVAECLLSKAEEARMLRDVGNVLDCGEDSFLLVPVVGDAPVRTIGKVPPAESRGLLYVPPLP